MAQKPSELMDRFNASDEFDATGEKISTTAAEAQHDSDDEARSASGLTSGAAIVGDDEDDDDAEIGETEQIRAKIEETRSNLGETIDAIQERLSIQNISEQVREQVSEHITSAIGTAKHSVYEATLGNLSKAGKFMKEIGRDISRTEAGKMASRNPFPLVLIGLGVGLLAYQGFGSGNRRKRHYNGRHDDRRDRGFGGARRDLANAGATASGVYDSVSGTASDALGTVRDAAGNAYSSVSDAAGSAYSSVTDAATSAYQRVGDYAGTAYEKVGEYGVQAREQYEQYIEENPLAVGAVALAVGAAVGLALPTTRYENEYMGDYSRQVLDRAQSTAGELIDRVKEVAGEAKKTIGEEAEKQGFTS